MPDRCKGVEDITLKLLADYTPIVDTFRIGDTLTINSSFPDLIQDIKSGNTIEVVDFKFYSFIVIRMFENGISVDLDTQEDQIVNANIDYVLENFNLDKSTGISIDSHNYIDNNYDFSFGFIFSKSGLYVIGIDSFLGFTNGTDDQKIPDQCPSQELKAVFHRSVGSSNNNIENYNYALLNETVIFANKNIEEFKEQALYAFYVRE